jgi:hypothetical protein
MSTVELPMTKAWGGNHVHDFRRINQTGLYFQMLEEMKKNWSFGDTIFRCGCFGALCHCTADQLVGIMKNLQQLVYTE